MHSEGLDISDRSRVPNAAAARETMIRDEDDFDMIEDDIDLVATNGQLVWQQKPLMLAQMQQHDQDCFKECMGKSG